MLSHQPASIKLRFIQIKESVPKSKTIGTVATGKAQGLAAIARNRELLFLSLTSRFRETELDEIYFATSKGKI